MRMSSNTSPRKLSPPYLLLPSPYEVGYKELYSLTEKKVVSIDKAAAPPAWAQGRRVQHMGCSHGWVTSFNKDTSQTFLFDPITGCHMELPDVDHATQPYYIILSSSPDSPTCRAIMQFEPSYRLAVCSPAHGRGASWRPVCGQGDYTEVCYSTRHNHLFGLLANSEMVWMLECWDLEYPSSFLWNAQVCFQQDEVGSSTHTCLRYLVIDEHSGRLFLVMRIMLELAPDDDEDEDEDEDDDDDDDDNEVDEEKEREELRSFLRRFYHKTIRFRVYEFDRGEMRYMDGSLDGLAMFVGSNHAFALPAADFGLTPDSIYFNEHGASYDADVGRNDDIGICNYVNGKISAIDYHPSQKHTDSSSRIAPAMWLTPIPH